MTSRSPRAHLPARCAALQSLTWELAEAAALLYLVPQALKTPEGRLALMGTQSVLQSEDNESDRDRQRLLTLQRLGMEPWGSERALEALLSRPPTPSSVTLETSPRKPFPCQIF